MEAFTGDHWDLVGDVLAEHYRVDAFAGEGLLSIVYRGTHLSLNAPVAIKCLNLPPTLDAELAKPIREEFESGAKLHYELARGHLHIAQTVTSGVTIAPRGGESIPYIVREWFDGVSLAQDLEGRRQAQLGPRSFSQAFRLLDPAASALAYAHEQGVAHLSIRPSNVFLAEAKEGLAPVSKILDFGVGRVIDAAAVARAKPVGARVLFPEYAAPEQLDATVGETGVGADVYAFALVLVEVMLGRMPFDGGDLKAIVNQKLDREHAPLIATLPELRDRLPRGVATVLRKALELDPFERFATMGAFWRNLREVSHAPVLRRSFAALRRPSKRLIGALQGSDQRSERGGLEAKDHTLASSSPEAVPASAPPPTSPSPVPQRSMTTRDEQADSGAAPTKADTMAATAEPVAQPAPTSARTPASQRGGVALRMSSLPPSSAHAWRSKRPSSLPPRMQSQPTLTGLQSLMNATDDAQPSVDDDWEVAGSEGPASDGPLSEATRTAMPTVAVAAPSRPVPEELPSPTSTTALDLRDDGGGVARDEARQASPVFLEKPTAKHDVFEIPKPPRLPSNAGMPAVRSTASASSSAAMPAAQPAAAPKPASSAAMPAAKPAAVPKPASSAAMPAAKPAAAPKPASSAAMPAAKPAAVPRPASSAAMPAAKPAALPPRKPSSASMVAGKAVAAPQDTTRAPHEDQLHVSTTPSDMGATYTDTVDGPSNAALTAQPASRTIPIAAHVAQETGSLRSNTPGPFDWPPDRGPSLHDAHADVAPEGGLVHRQVNLPAPGLASAAVEALAPTPTPPARPGEAGVPSALTGSAEARSLEATHHPASGRYALRGGAGDLPALAPTPSSPDGSGAAAAQVFITATGADLTPAPTAVSHAAPPPMRREMPTFIQAEVEVAPVRRAPRRAIAAAAVAFALTVATAAGAFVFFARRTSSAHPLGASQPSATTSPQAVTAPPLPGAGVPPTDRHGGPSSSVVSVHSAPSTAPTTSQPVPSGAANASVVAEGTRKFDYPAAKRSVSQQAKEMALCSKPHGLWGTGGATVHFANDGSVAKVALAPPYRGNEVGECVTQALSKAHVAPFTGTPQPVSHVFFVPMAKTP
jgi:serine/threonine-protein kinase